MTDFLLLEKLHRIIKEIPKPRLLFRKGVSAEGFFRPYMCLSEYTQAKIFRSFDEITPVDVRFAAMLGDKGTADTIRNIKGMNVKFNSDDGEYNMLCYSIPVFFINEAAKLFKMFKAFTNKESFDGINRNEFWSFVVENPESINCAIRLFSNEGLSASYINTDWFSVDFTVWQNQKGEKFLVRYKWIPVYDNNDDQYKDERNLDRISAEFIAGFDKDKACDELESTIELGKFPNYELYIQMKPYNESLDMESLKRTLIWNDEVDPPFAAGIMKLTSIPEDYRYKCDMISFVPGNTVKGIDIYEDEFSNIINYIYQTEAIERGERS